jgi:hypothetical protein
MAKQRHILSKISNDSNDDNKNDIAIQSNEFRTISRIKPSWWLIYTALFFLSIIILTFQFESVLPFYVKKNDGGRGDIREAVMSCEWEGDVYYELKTKLGVSYEANHWYDIYIYIYIYINI